MAADKTDFDQEDPSPQWRYEVKPRQYVGAGQKPPPLAHRNGPTRAVVRIAPADRRVEEPRPDPQTPDITGRYQSDGARDQPGKPAFLLHVNQAGKHIEALLVRLPSPGTGTGITQQRLAGDLKDDGAFLVYSVTDSSEASGKLRLHGQDLIVDLPICDCPQNTTFHLREQRPTFLDAALESLIEVQETLLGPDPTSTMVAERSEILPLSDAQMLRLEEAFSDNAVRPFLEKRYQVGSGSTSVDAFDRVNTTDELDKYVGQALGHGWPRQQLPMVREYAKTILASHPITLNSSRRSQLQWVEDMATNAIVEAQGLVNDRSSARSFRNLRDLLGISAEVGSGVVHQYQIAVDLEAEDTTIEWLKLNAFHVRVYYGTLRVEKTAPKAWSGKTPISFQFRLAGGGVLAGKGAAAALKAAGSFSSNSDWAPADFAGWAILHDGGVWAAKKLPLMKDAVGLGYRDPCLVLKGRGNHPEAFITLHGASQVREGFGAEYDCAVGRIAAIGEDLSKIDYSRPPTRIDLPVDRRESEDVHFDFGSALLKGLGRQQVRIFCARWQRWLGSPLSTLRIVGHADTVDTEERNKDLSEMRAKNVLQAIKDVLGQRFALPAASIVLEGYGEKEADIDKQAQEQAAGHPLRDRPDRRFRRVDVYLNGRCVLVLWSA
jgi:outer membrane protein OmpA-like peptidoglycan-associated protein